MMALGGTFRDVPDICFTREDYLLCMMPLFSDTWHWHYASTLF